MARRSVDRRAVEAEIDRLRSLGLDALRTCWRAMFAVQPPAVLPKDLLARMIAYRVQEEAFGGLHPDAVKLLFHLDRGEKSHIGTKRRLKPGTVLIREYQGERYTVTVVPVGYVWEGTTYPSLSTIARAITGTAWGGPRFFGLRRPASRGEEVGAPDPAVARRRRDNEYAGRHGRGRADKARQDQP
jgi:hypothetical protein